MTRNEKKTRSDGCHAIHEEFDLLIPLRQTLDPIQRRDGIVRGRGSGRNRGLPLANSEFRGLIFIVVLHRLVARVVNAIPTAVSILIIH